MAVAHSGYPYFTIYDKELLQKVHNNQITGGNPPYNGNGVSFSADGALLAVAHDSSPYLTVYNTSDWSKVAITGGNPQSTGNGVLFSPLIGGVVSNEDSTPITDSRNAPVSREVVVFERHSMTEYARTISAADGRYEIPILNNSQPLMVVFKADNDMENSIAADWVMAN